MEGVLLLGLMAVLLFTMFQRSNRQRKELAAVQAGLAPGIEVMTASGLYATVVSLDDDRVTLESAPGQVSTWDRRAVARIVTPAPTADVAREPDDDTRTVTDPEPG